MLTQTMECEITNPTDLETERLLTVTVHLGNQVEPVGMIQINKPLNLLVILIPVFAGVIVLSGAFFIVVVAVFCRKTRQKDQKYDQLILELERLESSVARECKLGNEEYIHSIIYSPILRPLPQTIPISFHNYSHIWFDPDT